MLTIVVLIWAWSTIESLVDANWVWISLGNCQCREHSFKYRLTLGTFVSEEPKDSFGNSPWHPDPTGRRYLPEKGKATCRPTIGEILALFTAAPSSANCTYWHRYVQLKYGGDLTWFRLLILFTTVLYFLDRIVVDAGRWVLQGFERAILGTPVVSKVYGSVKRVTDFAFSQAQEDWVNRVVAIQYPERSIWSVDL